MFNNYDFSKKEITKVIFDKHKFCKKNKNYVLNTILVKKKTHEIKHNFNRKENS